ncbi:M23 family metallopeptidase [Primorskyibacter sp. 2E107]|uniref:M23 family metallopeptidase n=1 Tax=Primorskyibacter sp. 2E107 TaxID=3403458 RepID=UPI003AF4FDEB
MKSGLLLSLTILTAAGHSLAADPFLDLPIACSLGQDCYIEAYLDHDPGQGRADQTCGLRTRDGHQGIDFALPGYDALQRGVAVRAAADGVVEAIRDGLPDTPPDERYTGAQDCGNAVRIGHPNGLKTLYCHLSAGSVVVRQGTPVKAGETLGTVGQSGLSNFPHLHFSVLTGAGQPVDPFAPDNAMSCGTEQNGLWHNPPPYQPTGFFTAGFSSDVPTLDAVSTGNARISHAPPDAPLVLYGHMFLAEHGDLLEFEADGPDGRIFERSEVLKAPKKNLLRAFGRRAPDGGWPEGAYRGALTLTRKGALIAKRYAYVTVGGG